MSKYTWAVCSCPRLLPDALSLIHGGETGPAMCTDLLKHTYTFLFMLQTTQYQQTPTHMSLWHLYTSLDVQPRLMYYISANTHRTFATQHFPLLAGGVTTFRVSRHRKSRFNVQLLSYQSPNNLYSSSDVFYYVTSRNNPICYWHGSNCIPIDYCVWGSVLADSHWL